MLERRIGGIESIEEPEFNYIRDLVYKNTGIVLAPHKKVMVQSRLNIRLRINGILSFKDYVDALKNNRTFASTEILELINRITTNKTDFFRENHHFEFLRDKFFPAFEQKASATGLKKLRIWCAAASTGEEPYSIAITAQEYFGTKPGWDIKILATDIDTNVLETAKKGLYKADRLIPVPENLKKKYFDQGEVGGIEHYSVKQILKSMIIYKKLNLLEFPYPVGEKMDLIFCRNVIIYFDKPTQKNIFAEFENVLKEDAHLIIGHSETMFGISDKYKFLGHTIYQKKPKG